MSRQPKHVREARTATVNTLADARDRLPYGSVEAVTLQHCIDHLIDAWLSESFGRAVRAYAESDDLWRVEFV